jgi:sortase A
MNNKFVYKKAKKKNIRKIIRMTGLAISLSGIFFGLYTFFPLISWEFYLKPVFASQSFASPIPKTTIMTKESIRSLLENTANSFRGINYSNAQSWLPSTASTYRELQITPQLSTYYLSIPKIGVDNAIVSTIDTNLDQHLVHFPGTALPPSKGNAAIFGHSTLPQLFNPGNYKTIFANAHTLVVGDAINVVEGNTLYKYKIINISIVDADDMSYLGQDSDDSYLSLITCTPPGTTWKRLIIKSRLEKI